MVGLCEAMVDVLLGAGQIEGVTAEYLLDRQHRLDFLDGPTLPFRVGELGPVIRQRGVDLVGNGSDQPSQKIPRNPSRGPFMQLDEGELRGSVDGDRTTFRTVLREIFSSRQISRIGLP